MVAALLLAGCAQDLLPGEIVVGTDVVATRWDGGPGDRFGASVAGDASGAWATAAGVPELRELGSSASDTGIGALWTGIGAGRVYAAAADGRWWVDGAEQPSVGVGATFASGPAGVVYATGDGWTLPESGLGVALARIQAVAVGEGRVLAVVGGRVQAWDLDGAPVAIDLAAGDGGAIAEWGGVAWAGSPDDATPDGGGEVCNELGECIEGEPGDHLGRVIGGGYAAGTFSKWVVPARARFVPLGGGPVLVLDEGAEDQPLAVAGDESTVWLGAPYIEEQGVPGGAVFSVARP